jgi:hypothetical protein
MCLSCFNRCVTLNDINGMVFVMKIWCVFYDVETYFLNTTNTHFMLQRAKDTEEH